MAGAPDGVIVEVRDLDTVRRALRQLGKDLPTRIVPAALKRAGTRVVLPQAVKEAPAKTGRTRSSIRVLSTQTRTRIAAGRARLPYVPPIYWGWPSRNIEPNQYLARGVANTPPGRIAREASAELANGMRALALESTRS